MLFSRFALRNVQNGFCMQLLRPSLTYVVPYNFMQFNSFGFATSKGVKIDRGDPNRFNLVQRKVDKAQKMSPTLREDLNKQLSNFDELGHHNLFDDKKVGPDDAIKTIDTNFESFFY